MPLATDEFARRDVGGIETLSGPARLSWAFDGLSTGDRHVLRVRYTCGVRVADNPTDRRMFAQVLLSRSGTVSTRELNEHFAGALRAAAAQAASQRTAEQWTEGNGQFRQELIDALAAAGRAVAFACGL